jgi:hypothetical protein
VKRLAALLVVLAACGGGGDSAAPTTTTTITATTAPPAPAFDWSDPAPVDVDGWHLESCEGDAPLVCVERDGQIVGLVERLEFPLDSFDDLAAPLAAGDEEAAYDALAAAFVRDLTADRETGCEDGYTVEPLPVIHVTTPDGTAARYGFAATTASGDPAERVVQYAAVRGDTLVLLAANASSADGCLPPEGPEFTPHLLEAFEPVFDGLVQGR